MSELLENSQVTADADSAAESIPDNPKRPRGRPKGARNRVSRDCKELLAAGAPGAINQLLKIAKGGPIFGPPGPERKRERREVDIDQQLSAIGLILSRLLPALKASEITSTSDVTIAGEVTTKDLASALLGVLHRAIPERPEPTALPVASPVHDATPEPNPQLTSDFPPEPEPTKSQLADAILGAVHEAAKPRAAYVPPEIDPATARMARDHERELEAENAQVIRLIRRGQRDGH
jgi:hypothetical protein